jgi:Surface antigen
MRLRSITAVLVITATSILAGCVSDPHAGRMSNESAGTLTGATAGAIIGATIAKNDVAGAVVGAAIGGLVGNRIGANLDEESRRQYWIAQNRALETGGSEEWYNEDRGHRGRVTAGRSYHRGHRLCRPYESTVWISGRGEQLTGTACRNPDGTWSPV